MNIRQLEYFVVVARELNFTKASALVHIEQAPLSQAIRRLEAEIGLTLFERTTRHVSLTRQGEVFYKTAESILDSLASGIKNAKQIGQSKQRTIRIGYVSSAAFDVMPMLISESRSRNTSFLLEFDQIDSEEQLTRILNRELDGGLIRPRIVGTEFIRIEVVREPFVCAIPTSNRFADSPSLKIGDLKDEQFIMLPANPRTHTRTQIDKIFRKSGYAPLIAHETKLFTTIIGLVASGIGIALVPASASSIGVPGVKYVKLTDVQATFGLDFVCLKNSAHDYLKDLLDILSDLGKYIR